MQNEENNKKHWLKKFWHKYRLVIMQEDTFEEKLSFRLSRLNVFVVVSLLAIVLVSATTYLIAYTPLKQYIPGYSNVQLEEDLYEQVKKTDSLTRVIHSRELYLENLRNVLHGNTDALVDTVLSNRDTTRRYKDIEFNKSPEDSILRKKIQKLDKYNLVYYDNEYQNKSYNNQTSIRNFFFFPPLTGRVTNGFNTQKRHYGVDVVAKDNDAIKATLDGRVIIANWTLRTGYVIALMHKNNVISVYKHNASLLKEQGETVKAGEPIAIYGNTGELTTGPHLHFEVWHNGSPVNPREYMSFQ